MNIYEKKTLFTPPSKKKTTKHHKREWTFRVIFSMAPSKGRITLRVPLWLMNDWLSWNKLYSNSNVTASLYDPVQRLARHYQKQSTNLPCPLLQRSVTGQLWMEKKVKAPHPTSWAITEKSMGNFTLARYFFRLSEDSDR